VIGIMRVKKKIMQPKTRYGKLEIKRKE